MVTGDEEIKYGYLLDPCFQMVNTAGKPLTSGWIEVYIAGTRNKYYCSSDFAGTLHPFKIPLDSLGSNIILADVEKSYDVYVYNKFGNLTMSRYNITPGKGGAGGSISGSGIAEHWIGKNGQNTSVPAGSDTALKLPTSFEYEGSFIDRINENRTAFYLKEGLYLVQAVVNFKQSDQSLTNEICQVDVFTRSDDAPEDMSFNRDMAGPDSSDDSHCLKVSFIRCVKEDDEVSQIVLFKVNTPNAWSECYLQNVQIARLSSGGAGAGGATYTAGDYISIDEETNTISVTGIDPDSYATHDEVEQAIESATSAFITSADLPDLSSYATEQWVLDKHYITSADIPDIPDDLVTSAELAQTSGAIEQDIADLTSAISEALSDKMDKSSSADFYPRYENPEGYLTSIPSEYVTESEMSGYVHEQTSSFITSADLPDVSDMATKTWVNDQHYITSADVPPQIEYSAGDNIDITDHVVSVTDTSLLIAGDNVSITPSGNDYIISAQVPETSGYVTDQEMNDAIESATSAFITSADIPPLPEDLVTSGELATVSGEIVNQIPSLQGYATEEYVTEQTSAFITSADLPDLSDYATQEYVQDAIDSGTSAFITSADLPDVSDMATKTWVGEQGYLTSVPSEYVTDTELESELSGKADTSAIPDVSNFVTQEDIDASVSGKMDATESSAFYPMATNPSGYLVSSDLNGYATESYVKDETSAFITSADLPSTEEVQFEELDTSTFVDSAYVTSYVASQTSGKQDKLSFEYNEQSAISAINGSALAGGSSFDPSVLDAYIPYSAAGVDLPNSKFKIDTDGQAYKKSNAPVALEKDSSSTSSVTLINGGFEIVEGDIITVNGIANGISQVGFTITSTDGDPQYPPMYFVTVESDESGNHASWTVNSTYDGKTVSKIDVRASSHYDYIGTNTSATIQYVNGLKYVTEDVLSEGLSTKMDAYQSSAFYPRTSNPNNYLTRSQADSYYIPYSAAGVDLPNSNFRIDTSGQAYKIGNVTQDVSLTFYSNSFSPQETLTAGTYELTTSLAGAEFIECYDPRMTAYLVNGKAKFTLNSSYPSGTVLIQIYDEYGEPMTGANASNTTLVKNAQELSRYALESYVDSAVSGKQDTLTFGYDSSDKINAINGSAIAGGGGGGGSYTAGEFIDITNDVISVNSGDVSNLIPGSGILITQSSAGTTVSIDPEEMPKNTPYETVLWEGENGELISANNYSVDLADDPLNYSRIGVYGRPNENAGCQNYIEFDPSYSAVCKTVTTYYNGTTLVSDLNTYSFSGSNKMTVVSQTHIAGSSSYAGGLWIYKVVGINKKES